MAIRIITNVTQFDLAGFSFIMLYKYLEPYLYYQRSEIFVAAATLGGGVGRRERRGVSSVGENLRCRRDKNERRAKMAAKTKKARKARKPKPAVEMPESTIEASDWIRQIADDHQAIVAIEADLNKRLAELQVEAEDSANPFVKRIAARCAGLRAWADANRDQLTDPTAPKTIVLTAGEVCWRTSPPSIRLKDVDAVIEICEHRGLANFVRVKKEFDKQAALKDLETAKTLPGVTVEQDENFFIRPNALSAVEYSDAGKRMKCAISAA